MLVIRERLDETVERRRAELEAQYLTLLMKRDAKIWARWVQTTYEGSGSSSAEKQEGHGRKGGNGHTKENGNVVAIKQTKMTKQKILTEGTPLERL